LWQSVELDEESEICGEKTKSCGKSQKNCI